MIVATAGHIDHGKTALVKALTGVDADRLPEEKQRGLSIDLGFAYLPSEDGRSLGFVDVPGHERFIRNMLAGVIGVDCALLVVAADDGPMPQTIEHLAILDLLGVARGSVALTKIDRVSRSRLAEVRQTVEALVSPTSLKKAPIFPVSALTGEGIAALAEHLMATAGGTKAVAPGGHFRLSIDRVFTLKGAGQIVAGTVHAGQVRVGDMLALSPGGIIVRARGIHAQNREVSGARQGERCALNISGAGLKRVHIRRGDWLLADASARLVSRMDVRLRLLAGEKPVTRRGLPVHVHLGAADVPGRVAGIDQDAIAAGGSGLARLTLDRPAHALWGDRLILRDQAAQRTLAGGKVIDPFAPARGRARPERLNLLAAMEVADTVNSLRLLLDQSPAGVPLAEFGSARNLSPSETASVVGATSANVVEDEGDSRAYSEGHWNDLCSAVTGVIEHYHRSSPGSPGPSHSEVRSSLKLRLPNSVVSAIVDELIAEGRAASRGGRVHMSGFRQQGLVAEVALSQRILAALQAADPQAPGIGELAASLPIDVPDIKRSLRQAAQRGLAVEISEDRYLLADRTRALASVANTLANVSPEQAFSVRDFSDHAGIGRNLAIQVLEHFDRMGLTRRVGNARQVLKPADSVFGPAQAAENNVLSSSSESR